MACSHRQGDEEIILFLRQNVEYKIKYLKVKYMTNASVF